MRALSFSPKIGHAGWKILILLILRLQKKNKKKRFYSIGYEDGYKHGRLHGLIEGRALGAEKGFELWEELGFYEGAARLWSAIASTDASGTDACVPSSFPISLLEPLADPKFHPIPFFLSFFFFLFAAHCTRRGVHHASALLALIDRFPRTNPRPDEEGVDMSAQLRLIRSRYKAMCASLGVRARLQPAAPSLVADSEDGGTGLSEGVLAPAAPAPGVRDPDADAGTEKRKQKTTVWAFTTSPSASASPQGLSF